MDTRKVSPERSKVGRLNFWWESIQCWIAANTFTPTRLPPFLRSQLAGYLVAAVLQITVVASVILLLSMYSSFAFISGPSILVVLLIALNWGGVAGIFATLFGCLPIIFFLLPPFFSLQIDEPADVAGIILYAIIGITISLLASQTQRARAEADQQRLRFQDLFMQAPMPIVILRGPEHYAEMLNKAGLANPNGPMIVGKRLVEGLTGEKRQRLQQQLDQVYRTEQSLSVKEVHVLGNCRNGDLPDDKYFDITYQPTRDYKGKLDGIIVFSIDVTDQVRARKRIEAAEQQASERAQELEAIFEAIADPFFIIDPQTGPRRANRAARELLGIPDTVATGQLRQNGRPFEIYDEEDRFLPAEEWPQAHILAGEVLRGATAADVIMRTHDGRKFNLSITGAPVRSSDGRVQSAVLIIRDVTTRRQAEQERARLLASEQAVLNVIPVGISIVDAQGRLLTRNAIFEQIWGKNARMVESKDEYLEYKAWWTSNGKRLASEDWGLFRALTHGEVSFNEEIDIESFDGPRKTILHAAAPIYDEGGQLLGGVAAMLDVTERKQLERRTHEALEALLSMAQVIVQGPSEAASETPSEVEASMLDETDAQEAILEQRLLASQIAQRLTDLTYEVLSCERISISMIEPGTGRNVPLATAGLDEDQERLWWQELPASSILDYVDAENLARLQKDEILILDLVHQRPVERDYYGFSLTLAVPLLSGNHLLGVMAVDYGTQEHYYTPQEIALARAVARLVALVIEREQLLTERAEARANEIALRDANHLKDEFIGIAGHELRTPLTTIKASVQLAQRQLKRVMLQNGQLPDDVMKSIANVQNYLDRAERQVGMQNRLVNDLLDVSRVETGRLELHPALCNIIPLVKEVIEDQRYLTPDRTLTLALPEFPELLVMADADRLRQVVSNYLSNALKYSDADKPVAIAIETSGSRARVTVRDEGPGLSESQQQRVWERFYRAPGIEVRTGSGVGLGLGLHISRMIIERQSGRVGLQSAPGKGSTFWFTLPLAE